MELKQFPTLKEHLEYYLGLKAYPRKSLTKAGRNLSEIVEDFILDNSEQAGYGIKGMIKNHYLSQGYEAREEANGIWFEKEKTLEYVNIGFSDSIIMISVIDLSKK